MCIHNVSELSLSSPSVFPLRSHSGMFELFRDGALVLERGHAQQKTCHSGISMRCGKIFFSFFQRNAGRHAIHLHNREKCGDFSKKKYSPCWQIIINWKPDGNNHRISPHVLYSERHSLVYLVWLRTHTWICRTFLTGRSEKTRFCSM